MISAPVWTESGATRVARLFRSATFAVVPVLLTSVLVSACGSSRTHSTASPTTRTATTSPVHIPITPKVAEFGQAFRLGKLTIVVTESGTVPDPNPKGAPRTRLIVQTTNGSTAPDRAPGLAIVCEQHPQIAGGLLYADPRPVPRPFVAGRIEPIGAKDIGSITIVVNPTCPAPRLQISPGGATVNGLPGPVLISVK